MPNLCQVVLVEDSPTQAQAVAMYLRQYGVEVIICDDGPIGITTVVERRPAAVILDVNLPTMNGYQIARHLKRNPVTAKIPVIMLTKLDGTDDLLKGLEHGADHYIRKDKTAAEDLRRTLCAFGIIPA